MRLKNNLLEKERAAALAQLRELEKEYDRLTDLAFEAKGEEQARLWDKCGDIVSDINMIRREIGNL